MCVYDMRIQWSIAFIGSVDINLGIEQIHIEMFGIKNADRYGNAKEIISCIVY